MSQSKDSRIPSVLDTKETFLHFSAQSRANGGGRNSFFTGLYRYFNLRLADALDSSSLRDDVEVNKIVRRLRWCGSLSIIEDRSDSQSIVSTSKKCRSKFCYLCNRQKSKKLTSRLESFIESDQMAEMTDYRFYFLTLTLKHDEKTRNYDYLSELKDYQAKLFRSKVIREHFSTSNGIIQAFENSMVKGMHIHSHNMIFAPRLRRPVKEVEQQIRDKWMKLTKDSMMIRLDLIGKGMSDDPKKMKSSIMELFKYSTKMSFKSGANELKGMNPMHDRLAEWVISSKGKNFINAKGLFRGHGITAQKCDMDEAYDGEDWREDSRYFMEKTSKVKFSHSVRKTYSVEERTKILGEVKILDFRRDWEITDSPDDFKDLMHLGFDDSSLDSIVSRDISDFKRVADECNYTFDIKRPEWQQMAFDYSRSRSMYDHF